MLSSKHWRRVLTVAFAGVLIRSQGYTQPIGPLTNDNPIVMDHLIHLYDVLTKEIATRNGADPANADSRHLGAARLFGVSPAGYQTLGSILSAAKVRLDAVRNSQSQYVAGLLTTSLVLLR